METLNSCKQWNIPLSNKGEKGEGLVMKFEILDQVLTLMTLITFDNLLYSYTVKTKVL